jgi:hypothetical protein
LAWVAALAHITRFIAGATAIGASVARHSVPSRSRPAVREPREEIGARRRDQHARGPARQFDVAHGGFGGRVPQAGAHRLAGQRLEGQRRDELLRALGHHHAHLRAGVLQAPGQVRGLVGRDAAGHAQQDPLPGQAAHGGFLA